MRSGLSLGTFWNTVEEGASPPLLPSQKLFSTPWSRAPQTSTPKYFQGLKTLSSTPGILGTWGQSSEVFRKLTFSFKFIYSVVTFNIKIVFEILYHVKFLTPLATRNLQVKLVDALGSLCLRLPLAQVLRVRGTAVGEAAPWKALCFFSEKKLILGGGSE